MLDRFDCYELCVQSPRHVVAFLRGAHANQPVVLAEDFCGTAAISRRWCAEAAKRGEDARAVALDLDEPTLTAARRRAQAAGLERDITFIGADATDPSWQTDPHAPVGADVVFVGNFSIGYIHHRPDLVRYLALARERLARGNGGFGGGIFACDTYGGASAFKRGGFTRRHPSPGKEVVHYSWSHDAADPRTAIVENSISFRVEVDGQVVQELPRAFTYCWRLWSIAELREAMLDAGFASTDVYTDTNTAPGATPQPVEDPTDLGEDWIVLVVARD